MKWIYYECEARVIYSLSTDRQPVIYWATNHLLAESISILNTQETTKKQLYPSDCSSFPPLHEEILPTTLTVIEAFACISSVFMREDCVTPSYIMAMKIDVTKKSKWRPNGTK